MRSSEEMRRDLKQLMMDQWNNLSNESLRLLIDMLTLINMHEDTERFVAELNAGSVPPHEVRPRFEQLWKVHHGG